MLDSQEQNQRNPLESYNNFAFLKEESLTKEQEQDLANWKGSNKLKGAFFYSIFGVYLLIMGIIFAVKYDEIIEIRSDYYLLCGTTSPCGFKVSTQEKIPGPVYIFIEFKGYNQNTQVYLDGYDPRQIYANQQEGETSDCKPFRTNEEITPNATSGTRKSINGATLVDSDIAIPCGIRAYDHFTDTFVITHTDTQKTFKISTDNISWQYDREHIKNNNPDKQWMDLEDERNQVWMRPAGLSKFKKIIGRIDEDLPSGYNYQTFDITKTLLIHNLNSLGGRSQLLVVSHLAGGSIAIFGAIGLSLWHYRKRIPQ